MHSSIIIFKIYRSQHLVISQNQAQLDIISLMIFLLGIIILMIIFSFILVGPSMNMPHHGQLSPKPSSKQSQNIKTLAMTVESKLDSVLAQYHCC